MNEPRSDRSNEAHSAREEAGRPEGAVAHGSASASGGMSGGAESAQAPPSDVATNPGEKPAPEAAPGGVEEVRAAIVEALKTVYDPEIPVDIWELGLIYDIDVSESRHVDVRMTLTSPMCPVAGSLPPEVEEKVRAVPGVASASVELVWDPPWDQDKMTDEAKVALNLI